MGNSINCSYNFNNIICKIFSIFNEGVNSNTLEVTANSKIDLIEKNEFLMSSFNDYDGKKVIYRLNFESKKELQSFKESIEKKENIEKINTIYS